MAKWPLLPVFPSASDLLPRDLNFENFSMAPPNLNFENTRSTPYSTIHHSLFSLSNTGHNTYESVFPHLKWIRTKMQESQIERFGKGAANSISLTTKIVICNLILNKCIL